MKERSCMIFSVTELQLLCIFSHSTYYRNSKEAEKREKQVESSDNSFEKNPHIILHVTPYFDGAQFGVKKKNALL